MKKGSHCSEDLRKKLSEAAKNSPKARARFERDIKGWNKGFTKDTHPSVAKMANNPQRKENIPSS